MGRVAALLLALVCGSVAAQSWNYDFAVHPASPLAGEPFQISVGLRALACLRLPEEVVVNPIPGNVVQYELHMDDACFPYPEQRRLYNVPALPVGMYTLRLASCVHAVPPLPNEACYSVKEILVAVSEPGGIPVLSGYGLLFVALGALFLGLLSLRSGK